MKFRELSNELSMRVRDHAAKVRTWLGHYLHGDFKASPAFGAGDAKIPNAAKIFAPDKVRTHDNLTWSPQ